jgi:hypothetical protein
VSDWTPPDRGKPWTALAQFVIFPWFKKPAKRDRQDRVVSRQHQGGVWMKLPYRSLLGAVASVVMASTAMAQDHVRWNDDGTVDLMLGPDYDDTVITTTREELGTLFGPGELPFEGAEISVTVN